MKRSTKISVEAAIVTAELPKEPPPEMPGNERRGDEDGARASIAIRK